MSHLILIWPHILQSADTQTYVLVQVVGIDLSTGMLEVARQRSFFSRLVHGGLDDPPLPLSSEEFDIIVCVGVLSYVRATERRAVLEEFLRVSRPGSLISFAHRASPGII